MAKENIDVTVELHDALSRPADRAERAVASLDHEVEQLNRDMVEGDVAASRYARAMSAVKRAAGGVRGETDKASDSTKKFDANARAAGGKGGGTDKLRKGMADAGDAGQILQKVMSAFKWSAFATAANLAAGAVSALGAGAYAAVSGLSPLVGVLGALPALLGALLAVFGAVKFGFSGLGDAVKAVTDPAQDASKIAAAMDKLSPAAQSFVLQLGAMKKRTDAWKVSIQQAMLPDFERSLQNMSGLMPVLNRGLTKNASSVGRLAVAVSKELGGAGNDLRGIFARNTRMIDHGMTPALVGFVGIFLDFMVAGGPLAERFSNWIGTASTNLASLVHQGRRSGGLTDFLNRAGDLAADVGHVIGDIAVALFNTGKASGALSSMMGHSLGNLIHQWRLWTESMTGQNAIAQWFADAQPTLVALAHTVGIVATGFASLAGDSNVAALINQINNQLLPAIMNLASGAASALGPAIVTAVSAFVKFQGLLSFSPMAELLTGIATAANGLLDVVNVLPGPLKFVVASMVALKFAASGVSKFMPNATSAVSKFKYQLGEMKAGAQLYSEGMSGMARVTGAARGAMIGLKGAGGGLMAALGGPWGIAIMAGVTALGYFMNKSRESKQAIDDVKASLDQQTGAFTDNTRAVVAKALEDQGVLEAAQNAGVSLGTLTDAILGNKDAAHELAMGYVQNWNAVSGLDDDARKRAQGTADDWDLIHRAVQGQIDTVNTAVDSQKRIGAAMQSSAPQFASAAGAADANGRALSRAAYAALGLTDAERGQQRVVKGTTFHLKGQAEATQRVIDKTLVLQSTLLKNQRSYVSFRSTVLTSTKTLAQGAKTLDLHTQAGIDNKNALLDVAEAAGAVTNQAKRTKALEEARQLIYRWGLEAYGSKKKADALADSMITIEKHSNINGHITVTADGLTKIISDADRANQAISDLVASQGQVRVTHSGQLARRDGGAVWEGARFRVGEVGPELFVGVNGAVEVIGRAGEEQRVFQQPGFVLPNEFYEAAQPVTVAAPAPAPALVPVGAPADSSDGTAPSAPVPPITIMMPGDGSGLTPADVEQAAMRAYRRYEQERRERR